MTTECKRCGAPVRSFSPMRKWCVECRRLISLEQARVRKFNSRQRLSKLPQKPVLKPTFKLNFKN